MFLCLVHCDIYRDFPTATSTATITPRMVAVEVAVGKSRYVNMPRFLRRQNGSGASGTIEGWEFATCSLA
jgi:hypothetical protein